MDEPDSDVSNCPECVEFARLVTDYLDGDATIEVRQELMLHVHLCPHCARLLWGLERTIECYRSESSCEVPASARRQLWEALMRELRGDEQED